MRTTIVIDDSWNTKLKPLISGRGLSAFVNQCLSEHFERKEKLIRLKKLEAAYSRASSKKNQQETKDFDSLDTEEWPEW